ncbi:MAG: HD domain-containing phosphohydrolase [Chloroflexota bacterium]
MNEAILFVDDEENILAGFQRQFRGRYCVATAGSGSQGLKILQEQGPFAVVVADLRMPGMDGVKFLARVKELAPTTSRMLLTGHADLGTAIEAINSGQIFRFLTKPSSPNELRQALESALDQHRLLTAEQELLERTLNQSVQMLIEVFSLAAPLSYGRALRIRSISHHLAQEMRLTGIWQIDLAAMLSQIGCLALSPALVEKVNSGATLTISEEKLLASHPAIGSRLLQDIPRMEQVAAMVFHQLWPYERFQPTPDDRRRQLVQTGAQIIKLAQDYDQLRRQGRDHPQALSELQARPGRYNPQALQAIGAQDLLKGTLVFRLVNADGLAVGMALGEDVYSHGGDLLGARYQTVTPEMLESIQMHQRLDGLVEPLRVYAPA